MNSVRTIAFTPYYDCAMERNVNFLLAATVHVDEDTLLNFNVKNKQPTTDE